MKNRLILIALLGTALASALVFLYAKTRDYNPTTYLEKIALLRQIKQLDAHWELDAMKSKIGINNTYDPLINPLQDLTYLQENLSTIASGQTHGLSTKLSTQVKTFDVDLQQKIRLIEDFKSHNAVLRNSIAFLPVAADEIQQIATNKKIALQEKLKNISINVNKILLSTLVYEQVTSDNEIALIESEIPKLIAKTHGLPDEVSNRIDIFIAHVRTVLREHSVVNGLLKSIALIPTAADIDAINATINVDQQKSAEKAEQDRHYLFVFSGALACLFLYAVIHLIRSHAVINQINIQLTDANDNLEHRVQERTQELKEAQAELVTSARQAGMAEIATNVLHNVGNVLNSVTVSAGVVSNQVRTSKVIGVKKVAQMMDEHTHDLADFFTNDQKGKMLPDYLDKLAQALDKEQQIILNELAQLDKSVDHIKSIVNNQQSYAGVSTVFEEVQIRDLIEDALKINSDTLSRSGVRVVKEFEKIPLMLADRHRVLQILINLIGNARNAMEAMKDIQGTPKRECRIILRCIKTQDNTVQIHVEDNGDGISPENMSHLFEHGFTTRKSGHGFGLHSCVMATREMKGRLTATSPGVGQGATFVLELPLDVQGEGESEGKREMEEAI